MTDKEKLFDELNETGFVAFEIQLFLDTHPNNKDALRALKVYRDKYERLRKEYTEKYGMLSKNDPNNSDDMWTWIDDPWPWERQ